MESEFWKQFVGSLVRKLVTFIAGALIAKWGANQITDYFVSDPVIAGITGFVLLLVGVIWTWAKINFNLNFVNAAHTSNPKVPMSEVKELAKRESSLQVSV